MGSSGIKRYHKAPGREDPRITPERSVGATMLKTNLKSFKPDRYSRDNSIISPPGESMTSMLNRPTAPLDSAPQGLFDPSVHVISVKADESQVGFDLGRLFDSSVRKEK